MTYYDELDLSREVDSKEIQKAYRRLMVAFHPDNYHGDAKYAADKTSRIREAYLVLKDEKKRAAYDRQLDQELENAASEYNAYADEMWDDWAEYDAEEESFSRESVAEPAGHTRKHRQGLERPKHGTHHASAGSHVRTVMLGILTAVLVTAAMLGVFMLGRNSVLDLRAIPMESFHPAQMITLTMTKGQR